MSSAGHCVGTGWSCCGRRSRVASYAAIVAWPDWETILCEVPLLIAIVLLMVWHARRRDDALEVAEARAEERRSMLERQERFIHDASHELRTPLTIARGHLELLLEPRGDDAELDVALDELARIDAIIGRLLLLAARRSARLPPARRGRARSRSSRTCSCAGRRSLRAPGGSGRSSAVELLVDPERLRAALDALLENAIKFTREHDAIELRARSRRAGPGP